MKSSPRAGVPPPPPTLKTEFLETKKFGGEVQNFLKITGGGGG